MKFSIAAAITAVVGLAAAAPQAPAGYRPPITYRPGQICLTDANSKTLVDGFASLLTNYSNKTADALLASDFTDTSSSINALAGYPTDGVTFPSKDAFKAGQGAQPAIPFTVLEIGTVGCDKVVFRWNTTVTPVGKTVKGINFFQASNSKGTPDGWQIKTMYSEFNSLTWAKNVGIVQ